MDLLEVDYECGWKDAEEGFPSNYWIEEDFEYEESYYAWVAGYLDYKESIR